MLATLESLKRYIGISQGYFGEDNRLLSLLRAASVSIEEHCERSFAHLMPGYPVIPDDLALACVKLAAQLYLASSLSAETEALVAPYKNRE